MGCGQSAVVDEGKASLGTVGRREKKEKKKKKASKDNTERHRMIV